MAQHWRCHLSMPPESPPKKCPSWHEGRRSFFSPWSRHGFPVIRIRYFGAFRIWIPSGKLTWQWKMALLKMYSLFENWICHCRVLAEGNSKLNQTKNDPKPFWSGVLRVLFLRMILIPPKFNSLPLKNDATGRRSLLSFLGLHHVQG